MVSRASTAGLAAVFAISGCATSSSAKVASAGYLDSTGVPILHPPHSWDEVFEQLVGQCPGPERSSGISGDVLFATGYVLVSLGLGAFIFSQRQLDAATIAAGGVGVVAGAGELYTLFAAVRARRQAREQFESRADGWRAQWRGADPSQRPGILDAVAASCGEEESLARSRAALEPPPQAPPGS